MEILIISGLSGAGKSKAGSFLEDAGFYVVDNMPAPMILKFAEFCAGGGGRYDRVALVFDVRTTTDTLTEFFNVLDALRDMGISCRLLFLYAAPEIILQRFKETRRRHPLREQADSLEAAVLLERELMEPIRERADTVIDTSRISTGQLRMELLSRFGGTVDKGGMTVSVLSFGFKYGLPMEADLVFDVRFMPNPFYIESLRPRTGLDAAVSGYVFSFRQTGEFLERLDALLSLTLPLYAEEGKTGLVIAVGCTGGRHRSVAIAHAVTDLVRKQGYTVTEAHRDMGRGG